MRFGFYGPNYGLGADPQFIAELAVRAEAAGWDGFFLWDHLVTNVPPVVDPWVTLGAVAARTERIVLGPLIVPLARRRPQKVALEAQTLSQLAPGRFVLGVGLGAPNVFTEFGEDADWRVRAAKLEDALAFLRREPLSFPVWTSCEWPRRQPVHGADLADGVFPTVRSEDGKFAPPAPAVVAEIVASVPERARADCAVWGWGDTGALPVEEYEQAGATWWMVESYGLEREALLALADRGPGRLVRAG